MIGLTPKQVKILQFVQNFIEEQNYAPSYREIMKHFGFSSATSVYKHIHNLIRKGALHADKQGYRSLLPLQGTRSVEPSQIIQFPLVGNLSIGYPLELFIQPQMISIPSFMVQSVDNTYILQMQGDSLFEEGIRNSDLLLIEAKQDIQPGEMILGLINQQDSVLKRYYPEGQFIRLESQDHSSLTVRSEHISIQGVLVGLLRTY